MREHEEMFRFDAIVVQFTRQKRTDRHAAGRSVIAALLQPASACGLRYASAAACVEACCDASVRNVADAARRDECTRFRR